jgi:adenylate cyclase
MDARLERKLRTFAVVVVSGAIAGVAFNVPQGRLASVGLTYGILMSAVLGGTEVFVLDGPLRGWLSSRSFTASLLIRSAIYIVLIASLQWLQLGEIIVGLPPEMSNATFLNGFIYSVIISVLFNLVYSITNLIGARALLNFITGRYHTPVAENRFVLFVDIAGSTGLAERLGGVGIHRFLDRTFRLLTIPVVDYRGEVLNYVGDEIIVTWPEQIGAVDCRPLQCFLAMRDELSRGPQRGWRSSVETSMAVFSRPARRWSNSVQRRRFRFANWDSLPFAGAPTASMWSASMCRLRSLHRLDHDPQSVARLRDRPDLPVGFVAGLQRDA